MQQRPAEHIVGTKMNSVRTRRRDSRSSRRRCICSCICRISSKCCCSFSSACSRRFSRSSAIRRWAARRRSHARTCLVIRIDLHNNSANVNYIKKKRMLTFVVEERPLSLPSHGSPYLGERIAHQPSPSCPLHRRSCARHVKETCVFCGQCLKVHCLAA